MVDERGLHRVQVHGAHALVLGSGRHRVLHPVSIDVSVNEQLVKVEGIAWLRVHYLYPEKLDPRLLELLATEPKLLPYIDMPLQHAAPSMLKQVAKTPATVRFKPNRSTALRLIAANFC